MIRCPHARVLFAGLLAVALASAGGCRSDKSEPPAGSSGSTSQADAAAAPGEVSAVPPVPADGEPGAAPIEHAPPEPQPPVLALGVELADQPLFVDEPLQVRVRLEFPRSERDQAQAHRQAERVEEHPAPKAAGSPIDQPAAPADWAGRLSFALFRVAGEKREPVAGQVKWSDCRVTPADAEPTSPVGDWLVPADSVKLPAGDYVLTVRWAGKGMVADDWLVDDGGLSAEVAFQVKPAETAYEKAIRAERLALAAYRAGKFAEVRKFAQQAVAAVGGSTSPQRLRMLLAQADACLAMDDLPATKAIYEGLLGKMTQDDDLTASLKRRLAMIDKAAAATSRPAQ